MSDRDRLPQFSPPRFEAEVHGILSQCLDISPEELERWYQDLAAGSFEPVHLGADSLRGAFTKYTDSKDLGIDLPVWTGSASSAKPLLMVIAQDPLREPSKRRSIVVSTVFSLGTRAAPSGTGSYWGFLSQLLHKYDLYITDARKLFYRGSPKDKEFKLHPIHSILLRQELDAIGPAAVLTMGKVAREILESSGPVSVEHLAIPHLSGTVLQNVPVVVQLFKEWGRLTADAEFQRTGEQVQRSWARLKGNPE